MMTDPALLDLLLGVLILVGIAAVLRDACSSDRRPTDRQDWHE